MLCEDVGLEVLQVLQNVVCGKNSGGSLTVNGTDMRAEEETVPVIEEVELVLGRTPILEGFVAAARMLPTMLVASPTTPPTILVACSICPLISRNILDALCVPPSKTKETVDKGVDSRAAPSDATLLPILLPPPSMAEATFAISPTRLSMSDDKSLDSGLEAARAGLLHSISPC
jgi:hypothetical protein